MGKEQKEEETDFGICIGDVCTEAVKFLDGARLPLPEQSTIDELEPSEVG